MRTCEARFLTVCPPRHSWRAFRGYGCMSFLAGGTGAPEDVRALACDNFVQAGGPTLLWTRAGRSWAQPTGFAGLRGPQRSVC
eukprot:11951339-Heterocapsa_arctica.AAC.1